MANSKWKKLNGKKGFTLIEIIIVVAIIAVLSSIGLASFVDSSKNASLQTVQDKVTSIIGVAKSRSLSQTKPTDVEKCTGSLSGYYVYFPTTKTKVCLYSICSISPAIANIDSQCLNSLEEYNLPNEIEFADPLPGPYYFPILTGTIAGLVNDSRITIQGYNKQKVIVVSPSGVVSIERNE